MLLWAAAAVGELLAVAREQLVAHPERRLGRMDRVQVLDHTHQVRKMQHLEEGQYA